MRIDNIIAVVVSGGMRVRRVLDRYRVLTQFRHITCRKHGAYTAQPSTHLSEFAR